MNIHSTNSYFFKPGRFIQPYQIFHTLNGEFASVKIFTNIDHHHLILGWEEGEYGCKEIIKSEVSNGQLSTYGSYLIIIEDNLFVFYDAGNDNSTVGVKILYSKSTDKKKLQHAIQTVNFFPIEVDKPGNLYLLTAGGYGMELKEFKINQKKVDLTLNYNDDLLEVNEIIEGRLSSKNDHGLVILHGEPGTGKTTYLRYLISRLNKKVIFIPSSLCDTLATPSFLAILTENPNSILVIEDADEILQSNGMRDSGVATLLNLSDGLLSDCLNIQIICTFNSDLKQIDKALLRKGRVIARYEFKRLAVEKAEKLLSSFGIVHQVNEDVLLAELYSHHAYSYDLSTKNIGFR